MLSLFSENQFHRFGVEWPHGGQSQALDHVQRALFVLLEVFRLQMLLVGLVRGIDLEDADLGRILGALHRVQADDTRLTFYLIGIG